MGRPRKYIRLEEVLDLVLPLLPPKQEKFPVITTTLKQMIAEIKANPRVQVTEGRTRSWGTTDGQS